MSDECHDETWAFVGALLDCPKFKTSQGRQDIIGSMRSSISTRVHLADDDRSHTRNIVQACVDLAGGIDELLKQLEMFEGKTVYWQRVVDAAETLKACLASTAVARPVSEASIIAERQEPKFALAIGVSRYHDGAEANRELRFDQFTHLKFAANMSSIWTFVRKPSNQRLLSWLGGGGAVAAAGIWAVITYAWPAHETPTAQCVQQGVKIGGNVSGSRVSNTVSGGTETAGPCLDATKT